MCMGCVAEEVREPVTLTDAGLTVVETTRAIYATRWGGVGGPLHVQLDDFNLDDDFVDPAYVAETTEAVAHDYTDLDFGEEARVLVGRCAEALAACTFEERHVAVAIGHQMLPDMKVGDVFTPPPEWLAEPEVVERPLPQPCPSCGAALVEVVTQHPMRATTVVVNCPCGGFSLLRMDTGALELGIVERDQQTGDQRG